MSASLDELAGALVRANLSRLTCAPFGSKKTFVSFPEFTHANQDDYGWWHLSCSYQHKKFVQATLYNSQHVSVSRRESLLNKESEILPMRAYFLGHVGWSPASKYPTPKGLMVKEIRLWGE